MPLLTSAQIPKASAGCPSGGWAGTDRSQQIGARLWNRAKDAPQSKQTLPGQTGGCWRPRSRSWRAFEPLQQPPGEGREAASQARRLQAALGGGRETRRPEQRPGRAGAVWARQLSWSWVGWSPSCAAYGGPSGLCCRPSPASATEALAPQHGPPGVLSGAVMALTRPLYTQRGPGGCPWGSVVIVPLGAAVTAGDDKWKHAWPSLKEGRPRLGRRTLTRHVGLTAARPLARTPALVQVA